MSKAHAKHHVGLTTYTPVADQAAFYSDPVVRKNVLILNFYVALHDAAAAAQSDRAAAKTLLDHFLTKISPELADADADLVDDVAIANQLSTLLGK